MPIIPIAIFSIPRFAPPLSSFTLSFIFLDSPLGFQNRQTPPMSSPHTNTRTAPINQDDEGDICPICESECTCDNKFSIAPQKHRPLPLRVKVAASSSSNPKLSGSNKQIRSKPSASTSANAHLPHTGQFSVSDPRLKSHLLGPTIPKRRGRPPKVVAAARAALAAATASSGPECVAGPSTLTQRPKANPLKKIIKPCPKSKLRAANTIKPPLARRKRKADDSYHPKGLARRRPRIEDHDDSDEDEEDKLLLEDDDDVEPTVPLDLPTFISASSSSSESSLSSLSSSEGSDSEDVDMEQEEEQRIKDSEDEKERKARKDKARVRRELLGDNDPHQNGRSYHTSNRWDIKPRKRTVSASEGEADVDMDADSGDTTESEDEDQDAVIADDEDELDAIEVDRDGMRKLGVSFAGVVTGWSDGEDSNFDADLFFANLDSSESDSASGAGAEVSSMDADGEDGDQDSGDEIAEAMTLAAAAGLYDGWEGPIVFATRDVDVEMDLSPSLKSSRRRRMSSSILTTDDERVCRQPTSSAAAGVEDNPEDDNEVDLAESDGETTEEELIGVDGRPNTRAMMLFKWPVSVGAVDPMSTLTMGGGGNGPAHRPSTPQHEPEDLGDGSDKLMEEIKTPDGKKTGKLRTPRGPVSGTFQLTPQSVESTKTAVITGHQPPLPSPYPRSRRLFSNMEGVGHRVCIQDSWLHSQALTSVAVHSESFTVGFWPVLRANRVFECPGPIYGPRCLH